MAVSRRPIYLSVPVDMYHRRPDLSGVWKHVVAAGGRRMVTRHAGPHERCRSCHPGLWSHQFPDGIIDPKVSCFRSNLWLRDRIWRGTDPHQPSQSLHDASPQRSPRPASRDWGAPGA